MEFEEIDLVSNDAARAMIIDKTGHLGAPIVQIGNEFIFGYDPKKMESLLKSRHPESGLLNENIHQGSPEYTP